MLLRDIAWNKYKCYFDNYKNISSFFIRDSPECKSCRLSIVKHQ